MLFSLPYHEILFWFGRGNVANADVFVFETAADGDGVVGMNLEDWIGTFVNKVEFVSILYFDKYTLTCYEICVWYISGLRK